MMRGKLSRKLTAPELRNIIFGVEDSLVSTVGLLSGVAITGIPRETIILSGVVLIFVEAFSMGVGSFLSEASAEDLVQKPKKGASVVTLGLIMFTSYFVAGFIPLLPYLAMSVGPAFWMSILLSLIALFLLGVWSGKQAHVSLIKVGFRMLVVGGIAILIGILAGTIVHKLTI